jgi:hypothetical protein
MIWSHLSLALPEVVDVGSAAAGVSRTACLPTHKKRPRLRMAAGGLARAEHRYMCAAQESLRYQRGSSRFETLGRRLARERATEGLF